MISGIISVLLCLAIGTFMVNLAVSEWRKKEKKDKYKIYTSMIGAVIVIGFGVIFTLTYFESANTQIAVVEEEADASVLTELTGIITMIEDTEDSSIRTITVDGYIKLSEDMAHTDFQLVEGGVYRFSYDDESKVITTADLMSMQQLKAK